MSPLTAAAGLAAFMSLLTLGRSAEQPSSNATRPPAIFVFGDSIVDPGNNNAIATMVKCNFPPYGQDFPGHQATGRFSNGRVPSDILASQIGIKNYVPAYLGTKLSQFDILTGVNFASGGCGFDPLTGQLVMALTMDDQLKLFEEYKEKLTAVAGKERAAEIVATAVYLIVTGTDDLANTYFTTPFRRNYDLDTYIDLVVHWASDFLQKLYKLGGRRVRVTGVPPIGCVPSQRTNAGGIERQCVGLYNQAAVILNARLSKEVQRLGRTLPGFRLTFVDLYPLLLDMIQRPAHYGFEVVNRGCCGTGIFEVTLTCNSLTAPTCKDPTKFLFWDTYHLTQRGYDVLMAEILSIYGY